jgi:3-hydroxy-3-methylglutaryl CoA synthase
MAIPVGIDDLNIYAGRLSIDFSEIVAARGISDKEYQNVRFSRRSVVPTFEDPVTLAVNAAKPLTDTLDPDDFELLIVATETGLDYGKPLSSYIHKYLGLGQYCRNFEIKHACYAGTAAIQMAASWIRSDAASGKRALVIMSDIGRRHFHESAELSVGAGAVALTISAQPRVFQLEPYSGYASYEVYDTARPTPTTEWINPPLSLASYLDLLELAWEEYQSVAKPAAFEDHFSYMIYHTPLMSLIEQAHQLMLEIGGGKTDQEDVAASFARMVEPSLRFNMEIGNTYSGSLYAALAAVVEDAPSLSPETRVGCFSYGSGACAEIFGGLISAEARATLVHRQLGEKLATRRPTTIQEYEEAVLGVERSLIAADFEPDWESPSGHYEEDYHDSGLLVLENVKNHYRTYKWS